MSSYSELLRKRLTELRRKKGVSESTMSVELGLSKGYIQKISSGKALPSMERFLAICDYLDVSPTEFFDSDDEYSGSVKELQSLAKGLDEKNIRLVIDVANAFLEAQA